MMLSRKKIAALIATFLVSVGISYIAATFYRAYHRVSISSNAVPISAPAPTADPEDLKHFHQNQPYALLLLGYGGGNHQGGRLTDSMIVVYVQPKKQLISLISLPRDLWVPIDAANGEKTFSKINAAYTVSNEAAKAAVKTALGIDIHHFVALDFSGFTRTIDVLGGVKVKVEKTFDDPQYPIEGKEDDLCGKTVEETTSTLATMSAGLIEKHAVELFPCRYEALHFDRGTVLMDGATALKYVRSRHSLQDGNDFGRATRQRNLIVAVKERVFSLNFFPKILAFVSSLSYDLQTDLTAQDFETLLQYKDELASYRMNTVALTTQNILRETRAAGGQDVLQPKNGEDDWQSVHAWLQENLEK